MTGPKMDDVPAAVAHAVAEALGDAYDCTRTWSAWRHRTMGPCDFHPVAEDSDRVAEIALAAITAWEASKPQPVPAIDLEQFMGAVLAMGREAIEKERASRSSPLLRGSDWYQDKCREVERLLALIDGQGGQPTKGEGDKS